MTPRTRTIVLLAGVLALDSADLATVGAVAVSLERSLHIGDLELGLLASVVSLTAAAATIPIGWLTDRVRRVPLLAGSLGIWSLATLASGAAVSFAMLLVTRLALGAVQATSGPTLASLTGDLFRVRERSRIFGYIHAGELVGGAFGFLISGEVAALLSWRWAFWLLSLPDSDWPWRSGAGCLSPRAAVRAGSAIRARTGRSRSSCTGSSPNRGSSPRPSLGHRMGARSWRSAGGCCASGRTGC